MNPEPSPPPPPGTADPHFGSDEQMLAWCAREGIVPVKDKDGAWDWQAAWQQYQAKHP